MNLSDPVDTLKGIGPKTTETLNKVGIKTVRDFFYNLPRDYENFTAPASIKDIQPGKVVVKGKIDSLITRRTRRRNFTVTEGVIRDNTDAIRVVWFNQPYRVKQLETGHDYYFTGTYDLKNGRYQLTSPSVALATEVESDAPLRPVYVAHGPLKSTDFARLVNNSRAKFAEIPDLLPSVAPDTRKNALFNIHFPTSDTEIVSAREYLSYEELFELILASKLNQEANRKLKSIPIPFNVDKIKAFLSRLPFRLTNAQRLAAWEIFQDLEKSTPMNRLLQGDVGSGKTMVAALAAYEAALSGVQVALLAPTAILASQHYENLRQNLEPFGIKVALLIGATKGKNSLKSAIKSGEIDLIIGTHALLTDDTDFKNLGLVIIDEQHRFGVDQRNKLLLKSPAATAPHLLSMTATPIPRSLQLTVFGDLDASILNELPKGRQPITTKIITEVEQKDLLYPEITRTLAAGNQVYWICPEVGDGGVTFSNNIPSEPEKISSVSPREYRTAPGAAQGETRENFLGESSAIRKGNTSVAQRYRKLCKLFPNHQVAYLHGKMKPAEKDAIMSDFAAGKTDILVSTTVVEVGVDVPNASLIVIENAENFGLAQLHQLRGRVGRGKIASSCFLLTSGDNQPSRRLKELEKSTDGFHLAEVDLSLRGPGEIYGALQHGALDLRIATLSDTKLIAKARHDVTELLKNPENMLQYTELMQNIKKYQQLTTLN